MANDVRKSVNDLWQQAVNQLEEVKGVLSGRIEADLVRMKTERDRLLIRLGEQTYRLANQGKLPLPSLVRRTVDRLNEVLDGMTESSRRTGARKKKSTKAKPAAKKGPSAKKKAAKKVSKKKAKVTKRTAAKKATTKAPGKSKKKVTKKAAAKRATKKR